MKTTHICFIIVLSLVFSTVCSCNRTTPTDLAVGDQQIVTPLHPGALKSDCDTLVITCIDFRFAAANQRFINETLKLKDNYDHVSIPGGIYNLVNPETKELVLSKFAIAVKLHLIERVVIISHKDCGAYGGSGAFGSALAENEIMRKDLRTAAEIFNERFPAIEVSLYVESLRKEDDEAKVHFEKIPLSVVAQKYTPSVDFPIAKEDKNPSKYARFFEEEQHRCDALVITCSDFRFASATQELLNERLGIKDNYDYISIPGAIRNLLNRETRDLVFTEFGVSFHLHHSKRVIIIGHQDCTTGYGDSRNSADSDAELKAICRDLKKARTLMSIRFPHLKVSLYYATVSYIGNMCIYNYHQIP